VIQHSDDQRPRLRYGKLYLCREQRRHGHVILRLDGDDDREHLHGPLGQLVLLQRVCHGLRQSDRIGTCHLAFGVHRQQCDLPRQRHRAARLDDLSGIGLELDFNRRHTLPRKLHTDSHRRARRYGRDGCSGVRGLGAHLKRRAPGDDSGTAPVGWSN
jgi:hypothetical protein